MKILMTGATGLVGKKLGQELVRKGHEIVVFTRGNVQQAAQLIPFPCEIFQFDLNQQTILEKKIKVDAVIHLAGESIAQRWTKSAKKRIIDSRVLLLRNLAKMIEPVQLLISTSAVGIYGQQGDHSLTEMSSEGKSSDFLVDVCQKWELAADQFPAQRIVKPRLGVVLDSYEGAFPKLIQPYLLGFGSAISDGYIWMSGIHISDVIRFYCEALENKNIHGVYNLTAPHPFKNLDLDTHLKRYFSNFPMPSIPKLAFKIILGEMSGIIIESQKVYPQRIVQELNFKFEYENIDMMIESLVAPYKKKDHKSCQVFYAEQFVNQNLNEVFTFFSKAENLEKITPELLNFKILSKSTEQIEQGTLIDYKLKIHGIPVRWRTLIDVWQPPFQFVDTQLKGPYHFWYHTHEFKPLANGTLLIDQVKYNVPFGALGMFLAGFWIRKDIEKIFSYRRQRTPILLSDSK